MVVRQLSELLRHNALAWMASNRPFLPRSELNARQPKNHDVPSKTVAQPSTM